jgi:hypothetical protein
MIHAWSNNRRSRVTDALSPDSRVRIFGTYGCGAYPGTDGSIPGVLSSTPILLACGNSGRVSAGCRGRSLRRSDRTSPTAERGAPGGVWLPRNPGNDGRLALERDGADVSSLDLGSQRIHRAMLRCVRRLYTPMFVATFRGIRLRRSYEREPYLVVALTAFRTCRTGRRAAVCAECDPRRVVHWRVSTAIHRTVNSRRVRIAQPDKDDVRSLSRSASMVRSCDELYRKVGGVRDV